MPFEILSYLRQNKNHKAMDITLKIDSSNLGETVVDLFKNISTEKKEALATEILSNWLKEPYDIERKAFEEEAKREALKKVLAPSSYSDYDRKNYGTMETIHNSEQYRSLMRGFVSTKEEMVKAITEEATKIYREKVVEYVKTDKQLQKVMDATMETVKEDFPKFVHDAMMYWFAQQMSTSMMQAGNALAQSSNTNEMVKQICEKVGLQHNGY